MREVKVICGPTASGKSAFALSMAKKKGGIIINADALQVYRQLKIITCCPKPEELASCRHFLYNHVDVTQEYNAYKYVGQVLEVIKDITDLPIIIVGGTGLYIHFLVSGIHKIPEIDSSIRSRVRSKISDYPLLYEELTKVDPVIASQLNIKDTKRVARALEVFLQTGKSISFFYDKKNLYKPLCKFKVTTFLIWPDRELLYQNCNSRFDQLIKAGALEEAANLIPIWNSCNDTAKKSLGLIELILHIKGEISLQEAEEKAKQKTRNFAKRQVTWFKNQLKADYVVSFDNNTDLLNAYN